MKKVFPLLFFGLISFAAFTQNTPSTKVNDTAVYPYWISMMQNPDANYYQTVRAFNLYWQGKEITRGSGYKPFKRWQYYWSTRLNPDSTRNTGGDTYRKAARFLAAHNHRAVSSFEGDWVNLGPISKPGNAGTGQPNGNGRVNAIGFATSAPNHIYVGAPAGGLWISNDSGNSWVSYTDVLPTLGVSSIAVDYTNSNIIYIGTGDRDAGDAPGMGVFKSTDGGLNFLPFNNNMADATVGRLLMHPLDHNTLFAATGQGIFKSTDGAATWVLKKTGNFKDVVFRPGNPVIMYATENGNFWRSADAGETWTKIGGTGNFSRGVIGVTPAMPGVVYFVTVDGSEYGGTYRSNNSGLTFTLRSNSPNIMSWGCTGGTGGQGWYDLDVAVDPNDANTLYVGGVNVFKSTDGGTTWQINSHWTGSCGVPAVHADCHVLEFNTIDGMLYAGNDGGIYRTGDGGNTWTEITSGIAISEVYKIGQSATNKDKVMNGYQDNGSATFLGDSTGFLTVMGGDGMDCAYDFQNHLYAYGEYYNGAGITRLYNNSYQGQISNGIGESGAWVTPFALDVTNPETMFVGMKNIWRGTGIRGYNVPWQVISSTGSSDNIRVVEQSPANPDLFFFSKYNNQFYRTEDLSAQNPTWVNLTGNLPSNNQATDIECSPENENVVFITLNHKVYKSTDKGDTWTDISYNLPDIPMNTIEYYKNDQEGLYVGSDAGIFYKNASMSQWVLFSDGFPLASHVTEIECFYDTVSPDNDAIRASTYGRGLWSSSPWYGPLTAGFESSDTLIPVGCKVAFFDQSEGVPHHWQWYFEGATPDSSFEKNPVDIQYNSEGTFKVMLTVTNPDGSDSITKEGYITVGSTIKPAVNFTSTYPMICPQDIVTFYDLSVNCPVSRHWSFDPNTVFYMNGTNDSSANPQVLFLNTEVYDVTLTVSNQAGDSTLTKQNYVHVGGSPLPFSEDFDEGNLKDMGWTINNPDGKTTWQTDTVTGKDNNQTMAAFIDLIDYYYTGQRDELISPPISFEGFETVYMTFDYAYAQRYAQVDSLIVKISDDCGETWTRVYADGPDMTQKFVTREPLDSYFIPETPTDWCGLGDYGEGNPLIDLTNWAHKSQIKIAFESYAGYGNNLYIDNVEISNAVGIKQGKSMANGLFQVFPNPVHKMLNIAILKAEKGRVVIVKDLKGKELIRKNIHTDFARLDVSGLAKGMYLIQVQNNNEVKTEKIIIE